MTKDKAVAWAVACLAESFKYEYYTSIRKATKAAKAMTCLSGKQWSVKRYNVVAGFTRYIIKGPKTL